VLAFVFETSLQTFVELIVGTHFEIEQAMDEHGPKITSAKCEKCGEHAKKESNLGFGKPEGW